MRSIITVLLAIAVTSQARVAENPSSAQETAHQPIQLSDLINQAQANVNALARQIQEQLNLPDQETVINTVKEQSSNLVSNIQGLMKNVSDEIKDKNPELERMWTDVKAKLDKAVEDVNSKIPEAQAHLNELQTNFQSAVQVLIKESDEALKSLNQNSEKLQEDIAKFAKQAVDIAVQASQNMNTHLQQAAQPKQ